MTAVESRSPDAPPDLVDLLRRRVLNVVGHELRTPVTTLLGLADELVASRRPTNDLTEAILRLAVRLDRLVEDLLLAAGVTTAVPVGSPEPVNLRTAVETAVTAAATAQPVTVTGRARASARPAVVARLVDALLENALRYGSELEVRLATEKGRAVMTFASRGPELSEQELRLATEAFFRGERAVTTAPGLGLGLAVATTLARADGGDLRVDPLPGGGMVTTVELPSATAA